MTTSTPNAAVLKENLSAGLSLVEPAMPTGKNLLPVLAYLRMTADGGLLTLAATNLTTAISARIGAKVAAPFDVLVEYEHLKRLLPKLPADKPVFLTVVGDMLHLTCEDTHEFPVLSTSEFPQFDRAADGGSITMPHKTIEGMLRAVLDCGAPEDARPILPGVGFKFPQSDGDQRIHLAAANGYMAGIVSSSLSTMPTEWAGKVIIMPAKPLGEIVGKTLKGAETVTLALGGNGRVKFSTPNVDAWVSALEGAYPDIVSILRDESPISAVMPCSALRRKIDIAELFNDKEIGLSFLPGTPGQVKIASVNAEDKRRSDSLLDATINQAVALAVSPGYIKTALDGMLALGVENAELGMDAPNASIMLSPVGQPDDMPQACFVVMPMAAKKQKATPTPVKQPAAAEAVAVPA